MTVALDDPWQRQEAVPPNDHPDLALLLAARARFTLYDREALDRLPPPDPLIAGLLPRTGLAMLSGSRGLGKTLLALSLAATVATDLPTWHGMEVRHHGPVLYVSLEGFHGIPERLRAWEAANGHRADHLVWLNDPVNLKDAVTARMVGLLAKDLGVVALFVDSARAAGAGAEDTADMGALARGLELAQQVMGGLVLVLHNTGWDGTRERGSTVLPDACDATLHLDGDPQGVRTLKHRKFRDGPPLDPGLAFAFRPVPGTTSGVLDLTEGTGTAITLGDRVLAAVQANPGQSTAYYVRDLAGERTSVSKALAALEAGGRVQNLGSSRQHPSWCPAGTQPALDGPT